MKDTFMKLDFELLKRTDLTIEEKLIISYLKSFQTNNKVCYQTQEDISTTLGLSLRTLKRKIKELQLKKIIFLSNDRKYLIPFQNRKAIILVDNNNPLPIAETKSDKELDINSIDNSSKLIKDCQAKDFIEETKSIQIEEKVISKAETLEHLSNLNKQKAIIREKSRVQAFNRIEELLRNKIPSLELNE